MEFAWNSGGRWNGKPWSADMPTDSALLFYRFASFLAAPHWVFTQVRPQMSCPALYFYYRLHTAL